MRDGFVASFRHPGGNVTGITFFNSAISGKGLGLLSELVPDADLVALLVNPTNPEFEALQRDAEEAARALGRQLLILKTSTPTEIDRAFATSREQHATALLVGGDAFLTSRRQQIVALAARDAVPALYFNRDFIAEGGLMSYGNDIPDAYRRAGLYAGRILKGEKPADLPVDQATKFELIINLKTARALGLNVPPELSARADEVVESKRREFTCAFRRCSGYLAVCGACSSSRWRWSGLSTTVCLMPPDVMWRRSARGNIGTKPATSKAKT